MELIKNVSAYAKLNASLFSETYLFSELNSNTLSLAASIQRGHPRALCVFADTKDAGDGENITLIQKAKRQGLLLLGADITSVDLRLHSLTNKLTFFVIGEDDMKNVKLARLILEKYGNLKGSRLYVSSSGKVSELLLQTHPATKIILRRVDVARSFTNQFLYARGREIFNGAAQAPDGRYIGAVIIGMERYGTEMLKALSWCCQMPGYELTIDAFGADADAEKALMAQCPELMSMSGASIPGEAQYTIHVHSGTDIADLDLALERLKHITCVFVMLDGDRESLLAAVHIREFCERIGIKPKIYAMVTEQDTADQLKGIVNFRGQPYDIDFIGSMDACYSENVFVNSALERLALERHLKWGRENEFWAYEYNYNSSVASVIHNKLRIECGIPGAEKPPNQRTPEERLALARLEHIRWNAFMRSEGYRWSRSLDKSSRNDLAKLHHNLVPFDDLTDEDKSKDDI